MRALHTADWHIGQTLNGWSREREHEVFFARLADVLEEEDIDLLLVAGDIFDNTNPSGESQRLLYRSLAEFKRRRPRLVTVISGGNHDPALRLEAPSDLFESLDIHAIGTVRRQAGVLDAREHLVAIPGPNGDPALYVLAIPFLRAADLMGVTFSDTETGLSIEAAARSFHAEIVAAVEQIVDDLPLIATGHLHCTGGIESEGAERRILIGGSHAVPPDIFPPRLDYVALGHLHGPQSLDGGRVRYSGSCFPLSASEIRYSHGVTILEIDGRSIMTRHRDIPWPAPVVRLPKSGTMNLDDLEAAYGLLASKCACLGVSVAGPRLSKYVAAMQHGDGMGNVNTCKKINLALQGGGSHGALTWGVLDRLLEDDRLEIAEISGTSAGAMNAVVLADGFERGGREGARAALEGFWRAISQAALASPLQRSPLDRMLGRFSLDASPGYLFFESLSRVMSPYQLNPLNLNPLRDLVDRQVDFGNVNRCKAISVHVTSTHVRSGRSRIFSRGDVTLDAVMASACLPQIYPAVVIDGEPYWDGGYSANPALMPLVVSPASPDIVIVQINPIVRHDTPTSAREIINRVNEISFNTALIKELRAIALMQEIVRAKGIDLGAAGQTHIHLIHTDAEVQDLAASSKMNAEWSYLKLLFERGRSWADTWLAAHFDKIGKESSFDLAAFFDDPQTTASRGF